MTRARATLRAMRKTPDSAVSRSCPSTVASKAAAAPTSSASVIPSSTASAEYPSRDNSSTRASPASASFQAQAAESGAAGLWAGQRSCQWLLAFCGDMLHGNGLRSRSGRMLQGFEREAVDRPKITADDFMDGVERHGRTQRLSRPHTGQPVGHIVGGLRAVEQPQRRKVRDALTWPDSKLAS